ncbi:MAG: 2-phospho-L-lactate guanylyltransferase [Actinomycetota bacterium]
MAVLVPVKSFGSAKRRLQHVLSDEQREKLMRALATRVIVAAAPYPVAVVCDDEVVASWATSLGADVLWTPEFGLNGAVRAGVDALAARGVDHVVIAHGDLARPEELGTLQVGQGVTLFPDRRDDGTNVLALPTQVAFNFSYGPNSFHFHQAEAARLGLTTTIVRSTTLALDVDEPEDLEALDLSELLR